MITLISNSRMGVCEWCVSTTDEMNSLDKKSMSPSSTVKLIDETGLHIYMLKSDKSGWVEI